MKNTGLQHFTNANINNFTTNIGMQIRKSVNPMWREALAKNTRREVIVERFPDLDKRKKYIFVFNHSFDEDVIAMLQSLDRNAYTLNGTSNQTKYSLQFYALWANGMVCTKRLEDESRKTSIPKMERVLKKTSMTIFGEGGYNNTENRLVAPLFNGPAILNNDTSCEIVPGIVVNFPDDPDKIYINVDDPVKIADLDKYEGMDVIREKMATIYYDMLIDHRQTAKRTELYEMLRTYNNRNVDDTTSNPYADLRLEYMELRKRAYEAQTWYDDPSLYPEGKDVWDEELTMYSGHNVTSREEAIKYIDGIKVTKDNAWILAPVLARRAEDKKYDLKDYLRENIELHDPKEFAEEYNLKKLLKKLK